MTGSLGNMAAGLLAISVLVLDRRPVKVVADGQVSVGGGAQLLTSNDGTVLSVTGPDPRTVLRAYCGAASPRHRLEPLDVVPSARLGNNGRLGLMRDSDEPAVVLSIAIHQDLESNLWRAGGDDGPLIARPAPDGAVRAVRKR